ncbi:hypothetical protein FEM03_12560 [Phragmitibacter flavus]|uniref:Phytanoyl-CoA dioxygenase family protein n=1 Tax=Phragmitibacter flavus TaxID=2576071 RepID=A0A5R8KG27_9BACT|nr:hypothetical protein [Phragmitibacter flavus]TLD70549.1 hypothetical protein FEM03_12560 [Phragmitibacter flavus]
MSLTTDHYLPSLRPVPPDLGRKLHHNHMEQLGIADTMRLAYACNQVENCAQDEWRRQLYQDQLQELMTANGQFTVPAIHLNDGWAIDDSMSLPHLDRILASSEKIIAERSGQRKSEPGTYRSYFQDVWKPGSDPLDYPEFLDFATSSDILAPICHYVGCIPALSTTLPSGIRFVESNAAFDDQPDRPHDSQLYHIDYYSLPNVYVLVLLRDTTREHGPWTFLPRSISQHVKEQLGYWKHARGYRLSDEEVFSVANPADAIEFTGKRGTVLFIESSGCLHFGSRNSIQPRFQLMLGYTGACRTDFSETFMPPKVYPVQEHDSLLRKLVLQKSLLPGPV